MSIIISTPIEQVSALPPATTVSIDDSFVLVQGSNQVPRLGSVGQLASAIVGSVVFPVLIDAGTY